MALLLILIGIAVAWSHLVASIGDDTVDFVGYDKWTPPGQRDNVLYCPVSEGLNDEKCSCKAKRCWEINATACSDVIGQLHVEYSDIFGNAFVAADPSVNATLYEIVHTNGRLTHVPGNICSFADRTITVDFAHNRLSDISALKCMTKLDTLILDHNPISFLDNVTLSNMENLRTLSMSYCAIVSMDPNAIDIAKGNIFNIYMSFNALNSLDVTNVMRNGSFCFLDYQRTNVTEITNVLNFTVTEGEVLGPGSYNFNNTQTGSFFNFTDIGIKQFKDIKKYVDGTFWYDESTINCDCKLYPLFDGLGRAIYDLWGNTLSDFKCQSPERLKGFDLTAIFDNNQTDALVCDLTVECPRFCQCVDTPSEGHVTVNCSSAGLTNMPGYLPIGYWGIDKVSLILANNLIQTLNDPGYIHRLVNLDMTGNAIVEFDPSVATNMNDNLTTKIENQQLTTLPKQLVSRNPRNFVFGSNPVICDCANSWLGDWMRFYKATGLLNCTVKGEVVDAATVSEVYLGCEPEKDGFHPLFIVLIAVLTLSLLLLATRTAVLFKYELFLLKRKLFNKKYMPQAGLKYDVFLSFCENCRAQTTAEQDHDVFPWIKNQALVLLEHAGYTVYCPWFHIAFGLNREEEVACAIERSRHFVVCLCDCYLSDTNTVTEFDLIWKKFRTEEARRITVINFAPLRKRHITDRRLKAFRRLRDDLDFKSTGSRITERLTRRIGPPMVRRISRDGVIERNAKLTRHDSGELDEPNSGRLHVSEVCNKRFTVSKTGDRTYIEQFRRRQQRHLAVHDSARTRHRLATDIHSKQNNTTGTDLRMKQPFGFYEASV